MASVAQESLDVTLTSTHTHTHTHICTHGVFTLCPSRINIHTHTHTSVHNTGALITLCSIFPDDIYGIEQHVHTHTHMQRETQQTLLIRELTFVTDSFPMNMVIHGICGIGITQSYTEQHTHARTHAHTHTHTPVHNVRVLTFCQHLRQRNDMMVALSITRTGRQTHTLTSNSVRVQQSCSKAKVITDMETE